VETALAVLELSLGDEIDFGGLALARILARTLARILASTLASL
jgi:hypothetical protein